MGAVALHGGHRVVDDQGRAPVGHRCGIVDQHRPRTARPCGTDVVVPVAPGGAHGHEEVARLDQARVEAEPVEAAAVGDAARLQPRHGGHEIVEVDHRRPADPSAGPRARSVAARRSARSMPASTMRWSTAHGGSGSASASHWE